MATPESSAPTERAPRRLVLLEGDEQSAVVQVLQEYTGTQVGATRLHADLLKAAAEHPGHFAAIEWQSAIGWTRYLWSRSG